MFADISGFTAMAEKMDPEEVTGIINQCFSILASVVSAHGGHVDKYIGDCVMAVFGVPAAIEKAPQQAINAAIEMRNRLALLNQDKHLPVPLDMHIGINTGLVIAGYVGGEVKREFTVVGDTVNLAARLGDVAKSGAIYVGPETYRYTREDFDFRKLPPVALKGKERPVEAYEVLSLREHIHRAKPRRTDQMISSVLVGRDRERILLKACVAAVMRGEGGIVTLIGEAGLGKSRLLAETLAAEENPGLMVLEGRSVSMGQGLSFYPFIDLLEHWAGINEDDGERERQSKLEAAVDGLLAAEGREVFPFVATLMGMRLTGAHAARVEGIAGESLELLIVKSMRTLVQRIAQANPVGLIFEDLHWADLSSIRLLESVLGLVEDNPILFIHAFRPDYADTSERVLRTARDQYRPHHTEIVLDPLDDRECDALIRNLLKAEDLPYATLALISRTAEGNPFYLEEVVRSLIDEGVVEYVKGRVRVTEKVDAVVIPGTIQGVIMARVDRLPESTRDLLQVASVLGRSFYSRILAAIVPPGTNLDADLAYLQERQLLFERATRRTATVRRQTLAEEVEYVFKNALVQETIYESILQKKRKELHLKVAESIEATFAERIADFYGMLAYHFSRAEHLEKAEQYLFKAGDEAARAAASSEALAFFREASRLYLMVHPDGGDPRKKALLEKNIGLALLNKGELTESIDHFDRALAHLGEPVPRTTVAKAWRFALDFPAVLFHVYFRAAPHDTTRNLDHEREVCELFFYRGRAETTSDPRRLFLELPTGLRRFTRIDPRQIDQACGMYVSCAGLFAYSGISFGISARMLEVAKTLIREGNVVDRFVYQAMGQFVHHYLRGNWDEQYAIDDALVQEDLRYGQVWDVTTYLGLDCDRRLRRGEFAAARRLLAQLGDINDTYGYGFASETHDGMLPLLLLEERQLADALRAAERCHATRHEYAIKVVALAIMAKAHVLCGDLTAAAAALAKAADTARQSPLMSPWHESSYSLSRALFDVARLEQSLPHASRWRRLTLARCARRSVRSALRVSARVAKERTETYKLAGRLWWLLGKPERARAWWAKSIAEGERMGARPELARTYMEIGQRLADSGNAPSTFNGMEAAGCARTAHRLFSELGLTWDLERLEHASPSVSRAAGQGSLDARRA
jgi:class 3 adenylate cyclase/tetratricopeptide (TPR) repeat protein